jgi:nucleoside permease NupC
MSASQPRTEESMGQLVKELSDDLSTLIRQELALARAEMTMKGKQAGLGIGLLSGAGLIGFVALLALTTTVIAVLATTMKVWIAALIVTVVLALIAGALALIGKNRVAEAAPPAPEQTTQTLKEDVQWAKTRL